MTLVEPKKKRVNKRHRERERDEKETCRKRDYKEKKLKKQERDVKLMNQGTKKRGPRKWHKWSLKKESE